MKKFLFISVKQEYADKIIEGTKTIELRKARPKVAKGDYVIIYSISPVKAVVGIAQVDQLISHTPQQMWRLHSKKLGISKEAFSEYYSESDISIGIVLKNVKKYSSAITLAKIKEEHPDFTPPQTFKYFSSFSPTASPILVSSLA